MPLSLAVIFEKKKCPPKSPLVIGSSRFSGYCSIFATMSGVLDYNCLD